MRTPTHRSRPQTTPHEKSTPARMPQWRGQHRPAVLEAIAVRTRGLTWSERLLDLLLEELHVGDDFDRLVGSTRGLGCALYPQVVAIAVLLRHSWSEQDLARTFKRLPRSTAATAVSSVTRARPVVTVPATATPRAPRSSSRRPACSRKEKNT
jgi:hypothetical protein